MFTTVMTYILLLVLIVFCAALLGRVKKLKTELRRTNLNFDKTVLFFSEEKSKIEIRYAGLVREIGDFLCLRVKHIKDKDKNFIELLGSWTRTYNADMLVKNTPKEKAEEKIEQIRSLGGYIPQLTDEKISLLGRFLELWYGQSVQMDEWLHFVGTAGNSSDLDVEDAVRASAMLKSNRQILKLLS